MLIFSLFFLTCSLLYTIIQVTYELYLEQSPAATATGSGAAHAQSRLVNWEQRIAALETLVGPASLMVRFVLKIETSFFVIAIADFGFLPSALSLSLTLCCRCTFRFRDVCIFPFSTLSRHWPRSSA